MYHCLGIAARCAYVFYVMHMYVFCAFLSYFVHLDYFRVVECYTLSEQSICVLRIVCCE